MRLFYYISALCLIGSLSIFFATNSDENPSLQGYWMRVTDVSTGSLSGLAVWVDMNTGEGKVIKVHNSCCFILGDTKWTGIQAKGEKSYRLKEMWRYLTCEPAGYYETDLQFIDEDEVELSSGGYNTRWVRVAMPEA